jgi:hypothetical protein
MAAATQELRMDNHPMKKNEHELPRIDLAKLDNIPYYIESKTLSEAVFFFLTKLNHSNCICHQQRSISDNWKMNTLTKKFRSRTTMKTVIKLLSDLVKIMNDFLCFLFIENEENFELAVARQEETNKDKLTVI